MCVKRKLFFLCRTKLPNIIVNFIVMKVIENIKEIMLERNVPTKVIANDLGLDVSTISKIMNGHRELKVSELAKIAQSLEVRIIDLFTWPDRYVKNPNGEEDIEAILQIRLKSYMKEKVLQDIFGKKDLELLEKR